MRRLLAALVLATALVCAAPALAHKADPNYLTRVTSVLPATPGITMDVINRSDQLEMHNTSGKTVVIGGYDADDPYARLAGDGTVSVNTNSPAYYLNQDRYGEVKVPDGVGQGAPRWKTLDKTGRFAWHDHRMHWMARTTPPQVKDTAVRTKIFDWKVPVTVDGQAGDIEGTLFWTPEPQASTGFIVGGSVVVLLGCAAALLAARRRRRGDREGGSTEPTEAW